MLAGYFKVYLNCFATGTPVDCDAFVKKTAHDRYYSAVLL